MAVKRYSALALGLTAAGKYSYFPIVVVILWIFFVEKRYPWKDLLFYILAAAAAFVLLDPVLWRNPLNRLLDSILFHPEYAQGEHVESVGYAWYQPILWVSRSWAYEWHPGVIFYFGFDGLIFLFGLAGIKSQWQERRWVIVWMLSGMLLLLLWPTRWPQYTLVVLPAFCFSASAAIPRLIQWIREQEEYFGWFGDMFPRPSRVFWIGAGLFVGVLAVGWVISAILVGINRIGWTNINAGFAPLPSNMIFDIKRSTGGEMIIGTSGGVVIWGPSGGDGDATGEWTVLSTENSPLPDNSVLSIAVDQDTLWFGTRAGLASWNGDEWHTYESGDFVMEGEDVFDIAVGADGVVWIGTNSGAAFYDGYEWKPLTQSSSGLLDDLVLAVEIQPGIDGDIIWFGTGEGVSTLDMSSGTWSELTSDNAGLGGGGVSDLLYDSGGLMWITTLGGGLSVWDGTSLTHYRVSNSNLPYNTVRTIYETGEGTYWVATSNPDTAGGQVSEFDRLEFKVYLPGRTGYSGSETVVINQDAEGRIWFGTLTAGLDVFEPRE